MSTNTAAKHCFVIRDGMGLHIQRYAARTEAEDACTKWNALWQPHPNDPYPFFKVVELRAKAPCR